MRPRIKRNYYDNDFFLHHYTEHSTIEALVVLVCVCVDLNNFASFSHRLNSNR